MRIMTEEISSGLTEEKEGYRFLEIVLYFLFAIGPLVANAVLVLLGAISVDFAVDPTAVMISIPAFMFPFAFFQLFSGAISDVYGRAPVIVIGLVTFLGGLIVIAFSPSIMIFALGNLVSGIGFGFANPVILALLTDSATPEDIPRRMGIASALATFSVGLGPFIAGQMVMLGWQSYYLLFLIIVLLGIISISIANRPPKIVHGESGVRVLISNLGIELKKPVVLLMLVTAFLVAMVYLGTIVWTSRGLTGALDDTLIGILLLIGGISSGIAGFLLGSIVERYSFRLPIAIGFLTLFSGLSMFILVGDITLASSIPFVLLGLIAVGWTGGFLFPTMITYSQILSPERRGVLAGVVTFAFFLGSALIPTIYEPLFNIGMNWVYIGILGVSLLLLLLFVVFYRKTKSLHHENDLV